MADNVKRQYCRNCSREVYNPDQRVGLIHTSDLYVCHNDRNKVAE